MTEVNRDKIARVIRALQQKTVDNGCTEDEALAAAQKVGELMAEYRLTQSDIEIAAEPIEQRNVKRRQRLKEVVEDNCLAAIKRYCGVKIWFHHEGAERVVAFFGMRSDTDHAEWLYKMIGTTIMRAGEGYKRETRDQPWSNMTRRRAIHDFRVGMAHRISQRLNAMAAALEPVAKTGSGTALVLVRGAAVDAAYARLGLHLRNGGHGRHFRVGDAFSRGAAAGENVGLHRPVGGAVRGLLR